MACKTVCSLNEQNGYLLNGCAKKSRLKNMGVQHTECYIPPSQNPPTTFEKFCFRPTSPKACIFPNAEKRRIYRHDVQHVDRRFFHVKSKIEKTRLQEQIDQAERARKIPHTRAKQIKKCLPDDIEEWKESIRRHDIVWQREVLKHLFRPAHSSFWEEDEIVLEPENDIHLFDEEDCF